MSPEEPQCVWVVVDAASVGHSAAAAAGQSGMLIYPKLERLMIGFSWWAQQRGRVPLMVSSSRGFVEADC
jgi:hypothetical protein